MVARGRKGMRKRWNGDLIKKEKDGKERMISGNKTGWWEERDNKAFASWGCPVLQQYFHRTIRDDGRQEKERTKDERTEG